jgi:L-aspartate oxidase
MSMPSKPCPSAQSHIAQYGNAQYHSAQVLIVGTGIAGLFTALKLADSGVSVIVVTKTNLAESNSRYAQGGIAAVLPQNPLDSVDLHVADTLKAGAGLCDPDAVKTILAEGAEAIAELLHYGVPFDRQTQDDAAPEANTASASHQVTGELPLALTQEAAHSVRRIIHAGGDATGQSVEWALIRQVNAHPAIQVIKNCTITELWVDHTGSEPRCYGAWGWENTWQHAQYQNTLHQNSSPTSSTKISCDENPCDESSGAGPSPTVPQPYNTQLLGFSVGQVVLATGGAGQLYRHTTNPPIATGDGVYLAKQAGAALRDLEFVQFHPTAFYDTAAAQVRFLISEALRGEGGQLLNCHQERFATRYHPDGELAPRDVVTRAIFDEQQHTGQPHVWLSVKHLPVSLIQQRFPTILKLCAAQGVDICQAPIPVSPAAHYIMGGIAVNTQGQSTLPGLYAVGEVACSGLHGANRLASNSLLECVVLARRSAKHIVASYQVKSQANAPQSVVATPPASELPSPPVLHQPVLHQPVLHPPPPVVTFAPDLSPAVSAEVSLNLAENVASKDAATLHPQALKALLQGLMWSNVGIVRTTAGLTQALAQLNQWQAHTATCQHIITPEGPTGWQLHQLVSVALWVTQAALDRKDSVGAHYRPDATTPFTPVNHNEEKFNKEKSNKEHPKNAHAPTALST